MWEKIVFASILLAANSVLAQSPSNEELLSELRKGGYVLFIRHPKTNPDQADTDPLHLDNVKAQRQLSDEGRKQAEMLGETLRGFKIPVEKVISSKFYRAQEASKLLALGDVVVELDVSEGGLVVSPNENKRRAMALRELLATQPAEGKNRIIVSHKPNLQDAAGKDFGDLSEAEIVIFKPLGDGKFKVIARVMPEAWNEWIK